MIDLARYESPLGSLRLAGCGDNLVGLWLEGQKYFFHSIGDARRQRETSVLRQTKAWLDRYFAGERPRSVDLPLTPEGSAFRQEVWRLLREISYGKTVTYGEITGKMHRGTMSARAVGGAIAHNPISIIIPCHRVVGANGNLRGYAGGIDAKVWLLAHEGVDMTALFAPGKGTVL